MLWNLCLILHWLLVKFLKRFFYVAMSNEIYLWVDSKYSVEDFSPRLWDKDLWPPWEEVTTIFVGVVLTFQRSLKATVLKFENSELQFLKESQIPQLILSRTTFVPPFVWISTLEVADSMIKETHFPSVYWSLSASHDRICQIQWIHSLLLTLH